MMPESPRGNGRLKSKSRIAYLNIFASLIGFFSPMDQFNCIQRLSRSRLNKRDNSFESVDIQRNGISVINAPVKPCVILETLQQFRHCLRHTRGRADHGHIVLTPQEFEVWAVGIVLWNNELERTFLPELQIAFYREFRKTDLPIVS